MSQYYYAVAALPMLFLESEVFPGEQEFLDHCSAWLSDADFALLSTASLHPSFTFADRGSVLGRWYTIERALRNELVRARAARLHVDEEKYLAGDDAPAWLSAGDIESRASEAFAQENPLRAEQQLDEFRWQVLDQLEVGHYFDLDKLIVYYLKLQMLVRRSAMNRETGTALFDATYKTIIDRYYNSEQDTDQEVETQT
ncbi:MAG: DUF2764 family protein [Spirochaetaceae bacterium]|nr:MAG: DUF2764 family protein [Spirochaetaceae bacterium]